MKENILKQKSFSFAVRIIKLYNYLKSEQNEFVISRQLIRSGTAIGAIIREAEHAESRSDFIHKLSIALKEANESKYWLELLLEVSFISREMYESLNKDCEELLKLLISIIKTTKLKSK